MIKNQYKQEKNILAPKSPMGCKNHAQMVGFLLCLPHHFFFLFMAKKSAYSPAIHHPCLPKRRRHRAWRALGPYPRRCSPTWQILGFDPGKKTAVSFQKKGFRHRKDLGISQCFDPQKWNFYECLNAQDATLPMPWETNMEPQNCNVQCVNTSSKLHQFEVPR